MASSSSSSAISAFLSGNRSSTRFLHGPHFSRPLEPPPESGKNSALLWKWKTKKKNTSFVVYSKKRPDNVLQYRKLGDSDLVISEITLGTMTFGEQNTEKEAHEQLSYAIERGINTIDTSEMIILATEVAGYSERTYMRDNAKVLRVDAANIKESVEKSLKRLNTDYIDLLQIHWPR